MQWDETIFGFFQDNLYNIRFHETFAKNSCCNRLKNWRNISWKRNGIEIRNAPSNKILPLSSTPYVTTRRMCIMGSNLFWRQNTYLCVFTRYLRNILSAKGWKLKKYLVKTQWHRNKKCSFKQNFTAFFYTVPPDEIPK